MGKIFFSKNLTKYFFSKKLIFHVWSSGAKAPPKGVFFCSWDDGPYSNEHFKGIFEKEWNYKIFQKMEKTEIRPLFQLMASWPKKIQLWGSQNIFGPQKILGYPILGFLTLKSTKKMTFFIKNQNWTSISIHRILAQKIQLWGGQNIFEPQNMFEVLHFRIFDP